jgi:photosystem II stability/assembly factor-like uncharacterized protein
MCLDYDDVVEIAVDGRPDKASFVEVTSMTHISPCGILLRHLFLASIILAPYALRAADSSPAKLTAANVDELKLRSIGPALSPGRVADIAIDPRNRSVWYVATASGGLWKTSNRGLTWTPIFDDGGSYSLGCVTLDPNNPDVVWLGTGENQALRSVSFGDGIYKSNDAGKTWTRTGLEKSEHIGKILVDPHNSDTVYVACQGPLWASGGDRGLYKTVDGGKTWKDILTISEDTGVSDIVFDPRDPKVIYAAAYQRRRNVGVLVGGGPEGGIYKSTDAGATWKKLTTGIPAVDLGRIALAVSPQNPDVVYAQITAAGKEGGFFRSSDCGETWTRQSDYQVVDPQYYGEIYADPHKFDRVYAMDVTIHVTDDGGQSVKRVPWSVHPDNHALVFDTTDADHLLVGNDGGLYETYDGGATWRNFNNLPTYQTYRIAVDNALPFYNVYGGAQDNGSQGGPSRTVNRAGIRTSDWINIGGGDGMQSRVDPEDPNIVYSTSQNAALSRLDKRTGESVGIRPNTGGGEPRVRWNWDAPYIISPHNSSRLYLSGSRLFRSDDRGDNWKPISSDLTRQIDRDTLPVMGRVWDKGAVTKNLYTTDYGVSTALCESPLREGLLYVGTDDGLVQTSTDGGQAWHKTECFPGVPDKALVSDLCASAHDSDTVYAAFNNYQYGDFAAYLLKSTDRGKSWTSIAGDLPDRHPVWCIVEDFADKNLLFAGTEFCLFFTIDGGQHWTELHGGMPTTAIRDLEIQRRENDLACATFGRGFFILDDYSALRGLTLEALTQEGAMLPLRRAYLYHELGYVRAAQGNFAAPNPPFGAALTYYLRDDLLKDGTKLILTISNASGKTIRTLSGPASAGLHRIYWDLRDEEHAIIRGGRGANDGDPAEDEDDEEEEAEAQSDDRRELRREESQPQRRSEESEQSGAETQKPRTNGSADSRSGESDGPRREPPAETRREPQAAQIRRFGGAQRLTLVDPGQYRVTLAKVIADKTTTLGETQMFEVVPLPRSHEATIAAPAH